MHNVPTTNHILIANKIPVFRLVLPRNPSATEEYAAEELRRFLNEIAGVGPCTRQANRSYSVGAKTTIYLNDRDAAASAGIDFPELSPEMFHIESHGNAIFIIGGSSRGLLYGVYELLETLGCRWYTPELSKIPKSDNCDIAPICITSGPAFEFRDMFIWEGSDPVWWARNRMNGWYTPVPEYMGGHVNYGLFVHTFYTLIPPKEFFAEHPEYYSEVNGVRQHDMGQICLTNPDVLKIVTERVLKLMRENPRDFIYSISQNDWENPCMCSSCAALVKKEGTQSGPLIHFVNAVAEATSREFPDKLIDTLAYWYTLDAPRYVVPHPNVRVRLCSINCCQAHEYGTCDHPESARFLRALDDWGRVTKQMYIWHYCTDFANYPLPMPNFDEIHDNINLYQRRGIYGVFMQGMGEDGGCAESMALRAFIISKLLWNPKQPVWPLIDEFLTAYYGDAATDVRKYLDIFHEQVRIDRNLHPSLYDPASSALFDGDILERSDAVLAEGEKKVDDIQYQRIHLLRNGLTYARLMRKSTQFKLDGNLYRCESAATDRQELIALINDFRNAGSLQIRESESIDTTEDKLRNRFEEHPVVWLKNDKNRIAIIPNLGGRLLEWHNSDRQWLAQPDSENVWMPYPMSEGYAEMVQTGAYSYNGGVERYEYRCEKDSITVYTTTSNGIFMSREYRLQDNLLIIDSLLKNNNDIAISATWGAGLHLLAKNGDVTVAQGSENTVYKWSDIDDGLGVAKVLEGCHFPTEKWQVNVDNFVITHSFNSSVTRAIIGKIERTGCLALDLRTASTLLQSGEEINMHQEIKIEKI
jgi:hypothetical protein